MSDVVVLESEPPRPPTPEVASSERGTGWLTLFGVVLPAITFGVELTTGMCADEFFDPLRTWIHVLGVALVPAVALVVASGLPSSRVTRRRLHAAAYAMFGANLYFAAYFVPIAPLGVVALLALGLGLLPLTPLLALIGTRIVLKRLHDADPGFPIGARVAWCVGAVVLLICPDPVGTWTRVRLAAALHGGPVARATAIDELRQHSSADVAQRVLAEGLRPPTDPIAYCLTADLSEPTTTPRSVLYQAFGVEVDARRPARWFGSRRGFAWERESEPTPTRDGFASRRDAPRLAESTYEVRCDAVAATIETAWELVFANPNPLPAEAIGSILLPVGAVASGLTLWVDGEPREAAFSTRQNVQRAYDTIVLQRRDPALVVTQGVRRVRLSCFPIPAQGTMRLRLRFIGALAAAADGTASIELPCFESGTFAHAVPERSPLRHRIDVLGGLEVAPMLAGLEVHASDHVGGSVTQDELARHLRVASTRVPEPTRPRLWEGTDGATRSAQPVPARNATASALVVVVDGSASMQREAQWIANALERVDPTADLAVVFAGDRAELLTTGGLAPALPERVREATARLRATACVGGRDNAAALSLAVDLVRERPDATIVWVHAPQPIDLDGSPRLRIALELANAPLRVVSIATVARFDAVRVQLEGAGVAVDERVAANVGDAATLALSEARGAPVPTRFACSRANAAALAAGLRLERSVDVWNRLATYDEIMRLLELDSADAIASAQELAAKARLVTPVSGAVVLERDEQYAQFGMEAPGSEHGEFSAAPEPETYAMIALAGLVFLFVRARRGGGT
ncbi:MAG: hypothetical protein IPH13_08645 [Planctomycetes bacterium]|nr:hypothetical protein [Planctomycetota bacterium]